MSSNPRSVSAARAHRLVLGAATALVLWISIVGCSAGAAHPTFGVGCLLAQYHGDLVAENGQAVVKTAGDNWGGRTTVSLEWPSDWATRTADDGQIEVLRGDGTVQVRTGTRVVLLHSGDPNAPTFNKDGRFVVCAADPFAP